MTRSGQERYAVGLYRVSTVEQGHSGLGLEAQQASVRAFASAQGWTLVAEFSDIASGKDDRRPGFQAALTRCRQLGAVLVAARLDRITRRAHTLSQLLEDGYSIRAADMPGVDDLTMRIYAAMAQKCDILSLLPAIAAAIIVRSAVRRVQANSACSQSPNSRWPSLDREEIAAGLHQRIREAGTDTGGRVPCGGYTGRQGRIVELSRS